MLRGCTLINLNSGNNIYFSVTSVFLTGVALTLGCLFELSKPQDDKVKTNDV